MIQAIFVVSSCIVISCEKFAEIGVFRGFFGKVRVKFGKSMGNFGIFGVFWKILSDKILPSLSKSPNLTFGHPDVRDKLHTLKTRKKEKISNHPNVSG